MPLSTESRWVPSNTMSPDPFNRVATIYQRNRDRTNADHDELKNYRPISNLTFISKVIERLVVEQITRHLEDANLMPPLQSAYRCHHSTETALIKVLSYIFDEADLGNVSLLGLLDLSAAFDTVDHNILLPRLENSFEIDGMALQWINSFLMNRTQAVEFRGVIRQLTRCYDMVFLMGPS